MTAIAAPGQPAVPPRVKPTYAQAATADPFWVRALLIGIALTFLTLFLFIPLVAVFSQALRDRKSVV